MLLDAEARKVLATNDQFSATFSDFFCYIFVKFLSHLIRRNFVVNSLHDVSACNRFSVCTTQLNRNFISFNKISRPRKAFRLNKRCSLRNIFTLNNSVAQPEYVNFWIACNHNCTIERFLRNSTLGSTAFPAPRASTLANTRSTLIVSEFRLGSIEKRSAFGSVHKNLTFIYTYYT